MARLIRSGKHGYLELRIGHQNALIHAHGVFSVTRDDGLDKRIDLFVTPQLSNECEAQFYGQRRLGRVPVE